MNTMNLSSQASFFYFDCWTPELDTIILDTIIALKKETHWTETHFPNWFSMTIAHELHTKLKVKASDEDVTKRLGFLKRRYNTFRDVVVRFRVPWDQTNSVIVAADDLWAKILKHDWFAGAYYHRAEPEQTKLACVFGMSNVKVEEAEEVILISDSTEVVPTEELHGGDSGELNDEVNSPAIFPPPTVRRQLFADDTPPPDRESTTDIGIYFIDLTPDGQLRTRFEKGRELPPPPPRPVEARMEGNAGPSTISPHASSCGSNSPIGWWPNLGK